MTKICIIAAAGIIYFSGCRTIYCSNSYITPAFIGFSSQDIDTLIIRKYEQNDSFNHLIDTTIITNNPNLSFYGVSNDTTIVVLNILSGEEKYIVPGYDWQIYIPFQNRTVSISNIVSPQTDYHCFGDDCGCENPINLLLQDGQKTIPQIGNIQYYGSGYLTFISNQ